MTIEESYNEYLRTCGSNKQAAATLVLAQVILELIEDLRPTPEPEIELIAPEVLRHRLRQVTEGI